MSFGQFVLHTDESCEDACKGCRAATRRRYKARRLIPGQFRLITACCPQCAARVELPPVECNKKRSAA